MVVTDQHLFLAGAPDVVLVSIVIYNLACYFSLLGDKPKAIECLGRSLRMEPELKELIPNEPDFNDLRQDPHFQFVTNAVQQDNE